MMWADFKPFKMGDWNLEAEFLKMQKYKDKALQF